MKKLHGITIALMTVFMAGTIFCTKAKAISSPLSLMAFHVNGFYATNGTDYKSLEVSWTPTMSLPIIFVRGDFGGTLIKQVVTGTLKPVVHYQVFAGMSLLPLISVEAGFGMESWNAFSDTSSTDILVTGNLRLSLMGTLDHIFAGYSRYFTAGGMNEIRVGIGLKF